MRSLSIYLSVISILFACLALVGCCENCASAGSGVENASTIDGGTCPVTGKSGECTKSANAACCPSVSKETAGIVGEAASSCPGCSSLIKSSGTGWCSGCNLGFYEGEKVACKGCFEMKAGGPACSACAK